MSKPILQIIGMAIVAFIAGVITGYFVILPYVTRYISNPFLAGAILGGLGYLVWFLILSFALLWIEYSSLYFRYQKEDSRK